MTTAPSLPHVLVAEDNALVSGAMRVLFERVSPARLPKVRPEDLAAAWASIAQRARIHRHHLVSREQLSVRAEMSRILKSVAHGRFAEFTTLFAKHADVAHLIVTFLAILELAREQLIDLAQAASYAPIYVHGRGDMPFALSADET